MEMVQHKFNVQRGGKCFECLTHRQERFPFRYDKNRYVTREVLSMVVEVIFHLLPTHQVPQRCDIPNTCIKREVPFVEIFQWGMRWVNATIKAT